MPSSPTSAFTNNLTPTAATLDTPAIGIKPSELIIVGDRVFTDVILGNKLGALSVWTTGLWERELMPMRYVEYTLVGVVDRWNKFWAQRNDNHRHLPVLRTPQDLFVLPLPPAKPTLPSKAMRAATTMAVGLRASYRGSESIVRWISAWWKNRNPIVDKTLVATAAAPAHKSSENICFRALIPIVGGVVYLTRGLAFFVYRSGRWVIGEERAANLTNSYNDTITRARKSYNDALTSIIATYEQNSSRVTNGYGEARTKVDDAYRELLTRWRQLSSRMGVYVRRLQKSWPHSDGSKQGMCINSFCRAFMYS